MTHSLLCVVVLTRSSQTCAPMQTNPLIEQFLVVNLEKDPNREFVRSAAAALAAAALAAAALAAALALAMSAA